MDFHPDVRLAIDPQLRLRNDVDRAVLLTRPRPLAERNNLYYFLHPSEAVVLALFDGERTIAEVERLWADLARKPLQEAEREVTWVVDRYSSFGAGSESAFIEVNGRDGAQLHPYDPAEFVLATDRVDLHDPRLRKPYNVYYIPSLFCPQRCVYCYAKIRPRPEAHLIPLGRLREIFEELAALGVEVVSLSGGDPLARRDIEDIVESITACGMVPYIPSKTGLSYARARRLRDLGVEVMQVSLDSSQPEILDRMVGVKGYHRRAFRLMEDLRRAGMRVRVNTVLTPLNLSSIGDLIDYLGRLGNVEHVTLSPYARSMFCHRDELFVEREDLEDLEELVARKREIYGPMKVAVGGAAPPTPADGKERAELWRKRALCTGNRHGFVILPDGRVTVCEELYDHPAFIIGDLKRQSVMEMWSSPEALALLHPDQAAVPDGPCGACASFAQCNAGRGRCWRDVLKSYGWARPHFPDPRCPQAPPAPRLG